MPDISIVICTYNPERGSFSRCLNAVKKLDRKDLKIEVLIIDNNSSPPISEIKWMQVLFEKIPNAQIVIEPKQGLTNARRCGIARSRSPIVVFFDDDNEPDADYLVNAVKFMTTNPDVAIAGPGRVRVEYLGDVKTWLNRPWCKWHFQELDLNEAITHSNEKPNTRCSPFGTGMVSRKEIADEYSRLVATGAVRSSDRSGKSLTAAGDVQIVWLALKNGWTIAQSPALKLNHLIHEKKANLRYLTKLAYGGGVSWLQARYEIFPEEKEDIHNLRKHVFNVIPRFVKQAVYNIFRPRLVLIILAGQLGVTQSIYSQNGREAPRLLQAAIKFLGLP